MASEVDENGSIIVQAELIEGRWPYLRANWGTDRSYWY